MDTLATWVAIVFGVCVLLWRARLPVLRGLDAALSLIAPDEPEAAPAVATWGERTMLAPPDYGAYLAAGPVDPDAPLAAAEWLQLLNDEPNVIPHLAVCGPSGSGKSTLVLSLIRGRPGELVITTIKNAQDDPWGGFPAVRLGFARDERGEIEPDWRPIRAAIEAVYREVNARHADGGRPRTPLTLVIDELTATIAACGEKWLTPRLIHMWLTARSVGVRLIVMDPTANVKGWGLDGRGDVRESIAFIRAERDKSAMLGELEEIRAGSGVWLETGEVPALAAGPLEADRVWAPVGAVAPPASVAAEAAQLAPPTSAQPTPYEVNLVRAWHEGGETGMRALARRLYAERGGPPPYDGSGGPYYAVRAALAGVSDETLATAL